MQPRATPPNIRSNSTEAPKPQERPRRVSSNNQDAAAVSALSGTTFTVSGRFKQPEIVLFAEPTQQHSRVLVLQVSRSPKPGIPIEKDSHPEKMNNYHDNILKRFNPM